MALALPTTAQPSIPGCSGLCLSLASGTCTPVGSVTAASPLYPKPLTGQAYLTGSLTSLTLTLVFPAPFPLTLVGSVNLVSNVTTFTGLPDIPLTGLRVALNGGPTVCSGRSVAPPSGTATATLTDQNGDKTVNAPANFTIARVPGDRVAASASAAAAPGGRRPRAPAGARRSGHPSLSFRVRSPRERPKLNALTSSSRSGLSFIAHRAGTRLTITGVEAEGRRDQIAGAVPRPLVISASSGRCPSLT